MPRWYDSTTLAFGDESDVRACAQVFADVDTAMSRARPLTIDFTTRGDDVWSSSAAETLRAQMEEIPEMLRRFAIANGDVSDALRAFAPALTDYQRDHRSLQQQGRTAANEIDQVELDRERTIDRLRSQESDVERALLTWSYTYSDHPEVAPLNARLDRLHDELRQLERRFDRNGDDFRAAVDHAADLIRDADGVLYNNGWDEFWSQTLEPILEVVKLVLEIAAVVIMIVALFTGVGALLALIVGALLLAVSIVQVAGTAAAGHEVTAEMWFDLAINAAAVLTMGAARWAKGFQIAGKGSKSASQILKSSRRVNYIGKASRGKYAGKLAGVQNQSAKFKQWENATRWAERAEKLEGAVNVADGARRFGEGDVLGGVLGVAGGVSIGTVGRGETGLGRPGGWDDAVQIGVGGIGVGNDVADMASADPAGDTGEPASPTTWPGLDGLDIDIDVDVEGPGPR